MRTPAVAVVLVIGCSAQPKPELQPRGWMGHMAAAEEHERRAQAHEQTAVVSESQAGANWSCGDVVLNDQARTGGAPLTFGWVPCFDPAEEGAVHHRHAAAKERQAARRDREAAGRLLEAELAACRGIPDRELDHSPLEHTKEIAEIVPHRESGVIRGVRVEFKPVPGLTADWMRRAIACHQARYVALGQPSDYAPNDPTLLPKVHVDVEQRGDHLEVLVITETDVDGQVALERAKNLVTPQTASR